MTSPKFRACDAKTAGWEGGKVHHKNDPGGRTNQGVIQGTFHDYLRGKGEPLRDVFTMTERERLDIYWFRYWVPVRGEDLPVGPDLIAFDGGVNSGPSRSVRWLQEGINRAAGEQLVKVDGKMGPKTMAAVWRVTPHALVKEAAGRRASFVQGLRTFAIFGRGWMRRIADIEATATAWALANHEQATDYMRGESAKSAGRASADRQKAETSGAAGGAGTGALSLTDVPVEALLGLGALTLLVLGIYFLRSRRESIRAEVFIDKAMEIPDAV